MPKKLGNELMDETCYHIFSVLLIRNSLRFNELHKTLNELGVKMSKPTLSDHLKHLLKKKIVVRTVEEAQNVTYKINQKEFEKFEGFIENATKRLREVEKEKETLYSLPPDEQLEEVIRLNAVYKLDEIKTRINYSLYKKMDDGLLLMSFKSDYFKRGELWVIDKCINDEAYRSLVLKKIEELSSRFDPNEERSDLK